MKREHYRSGRISLSRPLEVVNDISLDDGDTLARLLSLELDTISVTEFVLVCFHFFKRKKRFGVAVQTGSRFLDRDWNMIGWRQFEWPGN